MMSNANGSGSGLATKKHGQPEPEQAARRDQDSEDDLDEDKPNATSYAVSDGTTVDVPDEVASAIDSFVVPEGYVAEGSRSQSMVYCWGVYLVPAKGHDDPDADARFYCMASEDCRSKECCIPCKNRHRGNVHKHLKKHHHLCGSRSMAHARKNERAGKSPKKAATVGRVSSDGVGLVRATEVQFVRLLVQKLLPFDFAEASEFRAFLKLITKNSAPKIAIQRVKHIILEMYSATKEVVVEGLKEEIAHALLPILHFSFDTWTCKVSGRKFLGIHVFWVDRKFSLRDAVLAVKPYSFGMDSGTSGKPSDMLWSIFKAAIAEFGLNVNDFASCTTDDSFVVKAMCTSRARNFGITWDWCVSHMAGKACDDSFGNSVDPDSSNNQQARDIVEAVIKVAEKLNNSPAWRGKFGLAQTEALKTCLKPDDAPLRWVSMADTCMRIIDHWYALQQLYVSAGEVFPLESKQAEFLELSSLLEPVASIMRDVQNSDHPMSGQMQLALAKLKRTTLCRTRPLKVYKVLHSPPSVQASGDPVVSPRVANMGAVDVLPENLTLVGRAARDSLNAAFNSGFYGRVWNSACEDPSVFKDAAVMLTPPYVHGVHLNFLMLVEGDDKPLPRSNSFIVPTRPQDVESRRASTWQAIHERAVQAVRKQESRALRELKVPAAKRLKTNRGSRSPKASPPPAGVEESWEMFGSEGTAQDEKHEDGDAVKKIVDEEIARFKALKMQPRELAPKEACRYWDRSGKRAFPLLQPVAQQVLGNQASVVRIERDFSGADALLSGRTTRKDGYYVEMVLFLNVNFDKIPRDVQAITRSAIKEHWPKRFTSQDRELKEAEDFLEPGRAGDGVPHVLPGD